jgi:hypothetical protein
MATSPSAVSNLPEGYSLEQPSPQPTQAGGLPSGYTLEQPTQSQAQPDFRTQRINQRTGQPTTLEDPEGVDRIAADPEFAKHTAQGAATSAAATGSALLAPFAAPAAVAVDAAIAHLGGLTKIARAARDLGWGGMGLKEAHDIYKMVAGDSKK